MNLARTVLTVTTAAALLLGGTSAALAAPHPPATAPELAHTAGAPAELLQGGSAAEAAPAGPQAPVDPSAGGLAGAASAGVHPTTVEHVTEAFKIVNDHRRQARRAPLAYNSALSRNAQQWADTMAGARKELRNPDPWAGAPAGAVRMDQYYGKGSFTGSFAGTDAVEALTHYLLDFFPRNGTDQFARDLTHLGIGVSHVATSGPDGPGWETYLTIYYYAYPAGSAVPGTTVSPAGGFAAPYTPPRVSPFQDVATSRTFYKEIAWLAERGVSTGWAAGDGARVFRPSWSVSRDQMAAFLYRMAGSPSYTPPRVSPFQDVATSRTFYKEIAWLAERGVSTGWVAGDGSRVFRPSWSVSRDQMAAFLYRADSLI
ncbi:hypothetical protein BJF77_02750 [Kocuria sp. CNJ-770]|uniref:S-layer homology domain-containing protein n=1 Tax=Kocuria sp. CNJ-770 TaxID=1904964 RepID=UPI00095FB982|nr:S-layer homology domain-containing protein [Kocuria sp. CNJ-770]OLT07216.1 hypothetical protein BJF77_02750 [Kocuria sp. CNJ-770]